MSRTHRCIALLSASLLALVSSARADDTSGIKAAVAGPLLEPSTLALIGLGLVGLAVFRARFRDEK
jgi:hypothetical protein